MGEPTLKEKTSKGLFWGGLSSFLQQLLNAAFGIYLARTLSPDDYGLVGMLAVFSLISITLQEGGFTSALINRKEIRHEDYNAVFWFNLLVSGVCYLVLFFCAPLIARYFHQPVLVRLARWNFLGFIMTGLGTVPRAYLTKKMRVREIAVVTIVSVIVSGLLGVYLAWQGMAYWALVYQALALAFLSNAGFWLCAKWRPSLRIDFRPVKEMLRFSVKLVVTSVLWMINGNLITVILGRHYSAERVGYYTQANKWSTMGSSTLSGMLNSVSHPALAEVSDDRERQIRVFRKMVRFTAFVSFPAMLGLALIAPEFITLALTDKWMDSILLMQVLCIGGAFLPISNLFVNLLFSRGAAAAYMWSNIGLLAMQLAAVYFAYPYGIVRIIVAITVVNVLWLLVWQVLSRREIGYSSIQLLSDLAPFLLVTVAVLAVAALATSQMHDLYVSLFSKILIAMGLYLFAMWALGAVTFRECIDFLKVNRTADRKKKERMNREL